MENQKNKHIPNICKILGVEPNEKFKIRIKGFRNEICYIDEFGNFKISNCNPILLSGLILRLINYPSIIEKIKQNLLICTELEYQKLKAIKVLHPSSDELRKCFFSCYEEPFKERFCLSMNGILCDSISFSLFHFMSFKNCDVIYIDKTISQYEKYQKESF